MTTEPFFSKLKNDITLFHQTHAFVGVEARKALLRASVLALIDYLNATQFRDNQ